MVPVSKQGVMKDVILDRELSPCHPRQRNTQRGQEKFCLRAFSVM